MAATLSSWEDKVIGNPTVMLEEEAQPEIEDTDAAPSSCKDAANSADHGSEMETEAATDATVDVAEESVELPEPRLLSWEELGTRQFEVPIYSFSIPPFLPPFLPLSPSPSPSLSLSLSLPLSPSPSLSLPLPLSLSLPLPLPLPLSLSLPLLSLSPSLHFLGGL